MLASNSSALVGHSITLEMLGKRGKVRIGLCFPNVLEKKKKNGELGGDLRRLFFFLPKFWKISKVFRNNLARLHRDP